MVDLLLGAEQVSWDTIQIYFIKKLPLGMAPFEFQGVADTFLVEPKVAFVAATEASSLVGDLKYVVLKIRGEPNFETFVGEAEGEMIGAVTMGELRAITAKIRGAEVVVFTDVGMTFEEKERPADA